MNSLRRKYISSDFIGFKLVCLLLISVVAPTNNKKRSRRSFRLDCEKGANRMFRYSIFLLNIYSNKMPSTLIVENVKMELDLRGSLFVKRMIN